MMWGDNQRTFFYQMTKKNNMATKTRKYRVNN